MLASVAVFHSQVFDFNRLMGSDPLMWGHKKAVRSSPINACTVYIERGDCFPVVDRVWFYAGVCYIPPGLLRFHIYLYCDI